MNKECLLANLIKELPIPCHVRGDIGTTLINGIALDSRQVKPGDIFICLTGGNTDGHRYIPNAIEQGASAVLGTQPLEGLPVPYLQVENAREAMAYLAAAFYDHPGRKLTVIGVTGTDGKTTTSNMIYQILKKSGIATGLITTVNAMIGNEVIDTGFHVTTPEAPDVQCYLAKMVDAGMTHVVLETTSHGLAQHRVTGSEYDVAVVTNVTHEHLDYHGSYEAYLAAKASLFESLAKTHKKPKGNLRISVLNADDPSYLPLKEKVPGKLISYSTAGKGNLNAVEIRPHSDSIDFTVQDEKFSVPVHCPIPGDYNVSNCLAAFGATVCALGLDPMVAAEAIAELPVVPGRMERIDCGQPFTAIVDFAHTPNALTVALRTMRVMGKGRLIAVFGSAGLRDREKRRMMGETSARLADISILTAEDPRTESLDDILSEMAAAAIKAGAVEGKTMYREPDRPSAIRRAVAMAQPGDLVAVFGKGHEQSMCFGEIEYPWDDRIAVRTALAERMGNSGEKMPILPTSTNKG
ncbi:MAG: UDP-N-acetylmuramoyl-L-alanyl-D-glutamate--2,6-diaminopimelate ligase [Anaerolineaceae bacterium]